MFMDAAAMKAKILQAAAEEDYDVCKFYHEKGLFPNIARDAKWEKMTLAVIAFNALWISIDTDYNHAEVLLGASPVFQIAEHGFCVYFSFEWFVRFMSFRRKRDGLKDGWFVFDSSLVFMMVLETWVMTAVMVVSHGVGGAGMGDASILRTARLLRLSRMCRMARLFRAMPELLILIKGMMAAMRSVFFTLCLLVIVLYVFGIALTQLVGVSVLNADGKPYFGTVPGSMYTLLLDGTLMDGVGPCVKALGNESYLFAFVFYVFVLLGGVTVMNMLIGVLCEVVQGVAVTEREILTVASVKATIQKVMRESGLDKDSDGKISREEFSQLLGFPEACNALSDVGVDVLSLVDNLDFIFPEEEDEDGVIQVRELSFGDFMELVLMLRGCNHATVKDIVDLRKFVRTMCGNLKGEVKLSQAAQMAAQGPLSPPSSPSAPAAPMLKDVFDVVVVPPPPLSCARPRPPELGPPPLPPPLLPFEESLALPLLASFDSTRNPASPSTSQFNPLQPFSPSFRGRQLEGCRPEDSEMEYRRARLVDALVAVQGQLAGFVETLPHCGSLESEQAANSGCAGTGQALVFLEPFQVRWLPGELSEVYDEFALLQQEVSLGLGGLQRVEERWSQAPKDHQWDDRPCFIGCD